VLLQNLSRPVARDLANVFRTIRFPFIDAAAITDFGVNKVALHALQGFRLAEEMTIAVHYFVDGIQRQRPSLTSIGPSDFRMPPSMSLSIT